MVKTYRDLVIWQKAMQFAPLVYQVTKAFPKDEIFGLVSQMRRCVVSIPSNIAEGFSRKSRKDYNRFLQIAMGSIFEIQTQLEIALNLGYLNQEMFDKVYADSRELERMLSSFSKKMTEDD